MVSSQQSWGVTKLDSTIIYQSNISPIKAVYKRKMSHFQIKQYDRFNNIINPNSLARQQRQLEDSVGFLLFTNNA